jgi:hypothetical protein
MTVRGELARVTGLSRSEAGRGNRALVKEGSATMLDTGVYRVVFFGTDRECQAESSTLLRVQDERVFFHEVPSS